MDDNQRSWNENRTHTHRRSLSVQVGLSLSLFQRQQQHTTQIKTHSRPILCEHGVVVQLSSLSLRDRCFSRRDKKTTVTLRDPCTLTPLRPLPKWNTVCVCVLELLRSVLSELFTKLENWSNSIRIDNNLNKWVIDTYHHRDKS